MVLDLRFRPDRVRPAGQPLLARQADVELEVLLVGQELPEGRRILLGELRVVEDLPELGGRRSLESEVVPPTRASRRALSAALSLP
jgi:hypothetical protein